MAELKIFRQISGTNHISKDACITLIVDTIKTRNPINTPYAGGYGELEAYTNLPLNDADLKTLRDIRDSMDDVAIDTHEAGKREPYEDLKITFVNIHKIVAYTASTVGTPQNIARIDGFQCNRGSID